MLGLFSGPLWLALFFLPLFLGEKLGWDAGSWQLDDWAAVSAALTQGGAVVIALIAWVKIAKNQALHGIGFAIVGLVATCGWTILIWWFIRLLENMG